MGKYQIVQSCKKKTKCARLIQVTGVAFDRWRCDDQTYRFGSVGEDCNLILWDFSFSALQKPKHVSRCNRLLAYSS